MTMKSDKGKKPGDNHKPSPGHDDKKASSKPKKPTHTPPGSIAKDGPKSAPKAPSLKHAGAERPELRDQTAAPDRPHKTETPEPSLGRLQLPFEACA